MKISDVKTFPTWVGGRNQLVVKVETDEGIHGWGESGLSGRELAVEAAVHHYREFLIGRDPRQMGALWQSRMVVQGLLAPSFITRRPTC